MTWDWLRHGFWTGWVFKNGLEQQTSPLRGTRGADPVQLPLGGLRAHLNPPVGRGAPDQVEQRLVRGDGGAPHAEPARGDQPRVDLTVLRHGVVPVEKRRGTAEIDEKGPAAGEREREGRHVFLLVEGGLNNVEGDGQLGKGSDTEFRLKGFFKKKVFNYTDVVRDLRNVCRFGSVQSQLLG